MSAQTEDLISIIIPNYNGKEFLGACLDSLRKQAYKDFEIILVDNGSTDGSVDFVKQNYPEAKIISLPTNKGFAYAVNTGIRESQGEYIALLNNDTEADPHWLEELCKGLENNLEAGFCASKTLFFHNRDVINSAGLAYHMDGTAGDVGYGELDEGQYDERQKVFGASGVAVIYRREMLKDVGLFDEDFFAFYEDVDLSFRAQLCGYQCIYQPKAVVYHVGGGTISPKNPKNRFLCDRNLIYVLIKNLPTKLFIKYLPSILIYQIASAVYLFKYGFTFGVSSILGKFAGVFSILKLMKRRKIIQRRRAVSVEYIASLLTKSLGLKRKARLGENRH
ncbi:MAG: glycosyltransferase family 2 protein [Actinomycetota bacterium]|nr:glycosyltransferase family 2 protein [Actinomycetota bacterium]